MKRTVLAFMAAFAFAAVGVFAGLGGAVAQDDQTCEDREVGSFDSVRIEGASEVTITQGDEQAVTICADDEAWVEDMSADIVGGTLELEQSSGTAGEILGALTDANYNIEITMPIVSGLDIHGSVNVEVENVTSDALDIEIHDNANVGLRGFEGTFLTVDSGDGAEIEGDGVVQTLALDMDDASEARFLQMDATDVEVMLNEASHARVRFSGTLTAEIDDATHLEYLTDGGATDIDSDGVSRVDELPYEELMAAMEAMDDAEATPES